MTNSDENANLDDISEKLAEVAASLALVEMLVTRLWADRINRTLDPTAELDQLRNWLNESTQLQEDVSHQVLRSLAHSVDRLVEDIRLQATGESDR